MFRLLLHSSDGFYLQGNKGKPFFVNRKEDGVLKELYVACSRDGPKKVYVQDLIKENKESVWKVIQANGHIYVCG